MIRSILKRPVAAGKTVAHICQVICSLMAGAVMVPGIRRLATLDMDEAQLHSDLTPVAHRRFHHHRVPLPVMVENGNLTCP